MTEPVSIIIIIIIVIIVIITITGEPGRRQAGRGARAGQGRQALLWRLRGPRPVRSASYVLSVSQVSHHHHTVSQVSKSASSYCHTVSQHHRSSYSQSA